MDSMVSNKGCCPSFIGVEMSEHNCYWNEVGREYHQPAASDPKIPDIHLALTDESLQLAHGFTVVELHCLKCQDIKFVQVPGDSPKPSGSA